MATERDILALRHRLERARALLRVNRLSEDVAWRLLQRTSRLMNNGGNTKYRPTLEVIYTLVQVLWTNTRQQAKLRQIKEELRL
jgi:hypothetical protein